MEPTKLNVLIIIVILASIYSASSAGNFAGRRIRLVDKYAAGGAGCGTKTEKSNLDRVLVDDHRRILKVNTNDYGRYDPSPALSKPRFKLIPN